METNSTIYRNQIETLLNIFNHYELEQRSLNGTKNHSSTIDLNDWNTSIMGASRKGITELIEGIKSVNKFLENSFNEKDTTERNFSTFPHSDEFSLSIFLLVIDGYAVSILSTIGIVLNIFGICHLLRKIRRKQLYSMFLSTLLVFDVFFLVFEFLKGMDRHFIPVPEKYTKIYHTILNSGIRCSMISSTFMLVAVARVRLFAIKKPFQHNSGMDSPFTFFIVQ